MTLNKNNSINTTLNPWTISGYVEAEGNFSIVVYKYNHRTLQFLSFNIHIHCEDIIFLTLIKNYFNCGTISSINKNGHVILTIKRIDDIINIIIPFFTKYPLRGTKYSDFMVFVEAAEIFRKNEHLTENGTAKLLKLKNLINTNRNKSKFIQPVHTLKDNKNYISINPHFISGFTIGNGHFSLRTNSANIKNQVFGSLSYGLTQHSDNIFLFKSFLLTLGLNNVKIHKKSSDAVQINISDRNTIRSVIIPFFELYPLFGMKLIAFNKIKDILSLLDKNSINGRVRWTPELKEEIIRIWDNNSSILNDDATIKIKGW